MSRRAGIPTPTERRARVRQLASTHTRRELAEALDVTRTTIDDDLKALGLHAKRGTTARPDLLARRDERRAKLRELAATHTRRELSLLLGVGPQALAADLKALGLMAKPAPLGAPPGRPWVSSREIRARREQVQQLAPTHTRREILERLGMAPSTLARDLAALGIRAKLAPGGSRQAGRFPPSTPTPPPARVAPRPQAKWCPRHPGVRVGAWGCRACNAQRDQGWEGGNNRG